MAASLDEFLPAIQNQDTKKRLLTGTELLEYIKDDTNSIQCEDMDKIVDGLVSWLNNSNYKIALNGLEVLVLLAERMKEDFRPFINSILPSLIDRMGDNKDQVREQAQILILRLMNPVSQPQLIFEKLTPAFSHKLWHVREEVMLCLQKTLSLFGAQCLSVSKIVPSIAKLLSDPTSQVRDTATNTLVDIYKHVGEKVRAHLSKKGFIPQSKLSVIYNRFDEIKKNGELLPTAIDTGAQLDGDDETDFIKPSVTGKVGMTPKRASSAPPVKRTVLSATASKVASSTVQAGGMDEESFIRSFEEVPKIQLFSTKELEEHIVKIKDTLVDTNCDWEKRVDALKRVRSLLIAGGADYDEFSTHLRLLELPFQTSVKDLRSQVVREACISIAYLSQCLVHKFDHFAENILPSLINLIPNCAKVMSTAGMVAIRFIIQNTHAPRLIPIITGNLVSKSRDIRRYCCEFLDHLLHTWPTHTLERHIALLQDAVKKGISDADPEARAVSRKAFWGFAEHFKEQADSLLNSLDSSKQKMLQGELSNSSSNNSLNSSGRMRSRASSAGGSQENIRAILSAKRAGHAAQITSPRSDTADGNSTALLGPVRSNSAIDLDAANRAKSRVSTLSVAARLQPGSGLSLPRNFNITSPKAKTHTITSPDERSGRSRARIGISQSQPSSRSGSPSSRLNYATYSLGHTEIVGRNRRKSGIPCSTGHSRETSPNRLPGLQNRRLSGGKRIGSGVAERLPQQTKSCVMAQRILQQSQEAEAALADALAPLNRQFDAFGGHSDEDSETSSVCSERSYSSYGRPSEVRLLNKREKETLGKDVIDILNNLASSHWADRKEGLLGLQNIFHSNRMLTRTELKKVTEIFTRMMLDPHTKSEIVHASIIYWRIVFSLFLDTLIDFVAIHKLDLHDWLYVLLTRLLSKMGADMLGSVQAKVLRALEVVRESFPYEQQFNILMRFIIDQTQTPNMKVKAALLNYLNVLTQMMDPSDFCNSNESRQAISKIITWTTESKSADVRKASQTALILLFDLNTSEFSMTLSVLPKPLQDSATKILHNHLRKNSGSSSSSTKSPISPVSSPSSRLSTNVLQRRGAHNRSNTHPGHDLESENLNPEEIYNSLRKTTAEIQNYSFKSSFEQPFTKDSKRERDNTSQDSGISGIAQDIRVDSPDGKNKNGYDRVALAEAVFDENELFNEELPSDQTDVFSMILAELSNHNRRHEERKGCMAQLIKLAREGPSCMWDEYFKTFLLILLETLGDDNGQIRTLSLRVLREIVKQQPERFQGYAELTILKILEAHKDSQKEVVRAAEDCAATLSHALSQDQSVRILNPIVQAGDYPVNLAAIKMLTKVIEQMSKSQVDNVLSEIIPGLIKGYDNSESSVRKASVFCLVALHSVIGDALRPHLIDLNGSKMKLLNLYIKRAQMQQGSGTPRDGGSSP